MNDKNVKSILAKTSHFTVGLMAMDLWLWIYGYGFKAMDLRLWIYGYGFKAMDLRLWIYGYGFMLENDFQHGAVTSDCVRCVLLSFTV